jgi:hypothetical protein
MLLPCGARLWRAGFERAQLRRAGASSKNGAAGWLRVVQLVQTCDGGRELVGFVVERRWSGGSTMVQAREVKSPSLPVIWQLVCERVRRNESQEARGKFPAA